MHNEYFAVIRELLQNLETYQLKNVDRAAELVADSIMAGGIIQAFGSGHSAAAAMEICERAGGLIPTKRLSDPTFGAYERIEGVGTKYMKKVDIRSNDVLILISNSGRNPMSIEMAMAAKEVGAKVLVVTSLASSQKLTSRHSCGKNLYEFADVVLDNMVPDGDAAVAIDGLPVKVCGVSSIAAATLLQTTMLEAIKKMVAQDYFPPVYMSDNVDGGPEFNEKLLTSFFDRLYHV